MSETPTPTYSDDPQELYAFFGLAFYRAQLLEQELINVAVGLHLSDHDTLPRELVDSLFDELSSKTFGSVLAAARRVGDLPAELEASLREALLKRNYLAHSFFVKRDVDLLSRGGRRAIVTELRDLAEFFYEVGQSTEQFRHGLLSRFGLTEEFVKEQIAKIVALHEDGQGAA